jgi:WD40 repeat protein
VTTGAVIVKLTAHTNFVTCLDANSTLASGSLDKSVIVWSLTTYTVYKTIGTGHPVYDLAFLASDLIAVAGGDNNLRILQISTSNVLSTKAGSSGKLLSVKLLQNRYLVSGCDNGDINVWNVFTPSAPTLVQTLSSHSASVKSFELIGSIYFMSVSTDGVQLVWNTTNWFIVSYMQGEVGANYALCLASQPNRMTFFCC